MTYILSKERDADVEKAFDAYEDYIRSNRTIFPPSAYELATSDWYYGFSDHKAPHDSWLEELTIKENAKGNRNEIRTVTIKIKLLSAYHDGYIEFVYPRVYKYRIDNDYIGQGHGDWRYDEFRLSGNGNLIHEIEWAGNNPSGNWLIEADDVHHNWIELKAT